MRSGVCTTSQGISLLLKRGGDAFGLLAELERECPGFAQCDTPAVDYCDDAVSAGAGRSCSVAIDKAAHHCSRSCHLRGRTPKAKPARAIVIRQMPCAAGLAVRECCNRLDRLMKGSFRHDESLIARKRTMPFHGPGVRRT